MEIVPRHSWDLKEAEARALQVELAREVDTSTPPGPCRLIAGADVSYDKGSDVLYAAVVVVQADTFELVERVGVAGSATFPYVPGLLSFREAPALIDAFRQLTTRPDVVLCDGQGIAHPRRLGIASHLGLWLRIPTVGCAKSWLFGRVQPSLSQLGPGRGSRLPLVDKHGAIVGAVVRTRANVQP